MARKSRKNLPGAPAAIPVMVETVYKTGIYARLSAEDKRFGDGGSLENQILMGKKFIGETPGLTLGGVFADNGLTGTNFQRPGFEGMMDEIRKGNINCVVVKDLSRFGRDYIEAGNFLEVIFPRLHVRFISIGDNYDSFDPRCQGEGMCVALKNMVNAFYAKDISVKTRTAKEAQQKKGKFIGGRPPYGYIKSIEDRHRLVVDEEAAAVVREIFRWKLQGANLAIIAERLNGMGVLTPGNYQYQKGIYKNKRDAQFRYWQGEMARAILENPVYAGHTAGGKSRVDPNRLYHNIRQPYEKWLVVEHTHEALVSQSDFGLVSEQLCQSKAAYKEKVSRCSRPPLPENIFRGLAFCADCGHVFQREVSISRNRKNRYYRYICPYCRSDPGNAAGGRHLKQRDFEETVYASITKWIEACADMRNRHGGIAASPAGQKRRNGIETQIGKLRKRFNHFPAMRMKLYDDFCDGLLTESEYRLISEQHNRENEDAATLLNRLENEKKQFTPQFVEENKRIIAFESFKSEKKLTREMLLELVERIEVGNDLDVTITFRYRDEYDELYGFIQEHEESAEKGGKP